MVAVEGHPHRVLWLAEQPQPGLGIRRSVDAVRDAGYRAATVIRSGIAADLSDPYRLRRVPVRGTDPLLDLSLALTRGRSKF